MSFELVDYHHPRLGFRLPLPPDWEQRSDPYEGVALVAVIPAGDYGFRTNVVVTLDEVPEVDLSVWQFSAAQLLEQGLVEFVLLDEEYVEIGGRAAVRRLGHHTVGDDAVTIEQWAVLDQGVGYTLTASTDTWVYDHAADLLTAIASGFRPGDPVAS